MPLLDWVSQFETTKEQLLALKLFENIFYYDEEQIRRGFKALHSRLLAEGVKLERTQFTSLGSAKSGQIMTYLYRQANYLGGIRKIPMKELPQRLFIPPLDTLHPKYLPQKEPQIDTLVLLDDTIGNGTEAGKSFEKISEYLKQYKQVYYLVLDAYPPGLEKLKREFPYIRVMSYREPRLITDPKNTAFTTEEKDAFLSLMHKYRHRFPPKMDPYWTKQTLTVFSYNTPATVPLIFSFGKHGFWRAILPRQYGIHSEKIKYYF